MLIWLSATAQSNKVWTLQECVDYAMKNNIRVQQNELTLDQAVVNYNQSRAGALPSVNGSANHSYNIGRNVDPFTNQYINSSITSTSFSVTGNWTVFNGLQQYRNIQQNKFAFMASQQELEVVKSDISLSVANYYLQILQNIELVSINQFQVAATSQQLDRAKIMVASGRLPLSNQLDLEAQLAQDELNLVNAQNNLRISYLNMTSLLQLPDDSNFRIAQPLLDKLPELALSSSNELFEQAAPQRPEVIGAEYRVRSAIAGYRSAQGGRSPRLVLFGNLNTLYTDSRLEITGTSLTGQQPIGIVDGTGQIVYTPTYHYDTRVTPFNNQIRDNFGRQFGLNLSVPIFNGLQVESNIKRAAINLKQNELTLQQNKVNLYNTLAQSLNDARSAKARYDAAEKAVPRRVKATNTTKGALKPVH